MNLTRRGFLKTTGAAVAGLAATQWNIDAAVHEPWLNSATKNELADIAVGLAKKLGATYGDIRINRYRNERIFTRERQVQNVSLNQSFGFGVRVLVKGSWGFAASSEVTPAEVRRVTRAAVDMAKANAARQRKPVQFLDVPGVKANWRSDFQQDPFEVSIEQKIETLMKINEAALAVSGVGFVNSAWRG
jgi:TldD protein